MTGTVTPWLAFAAALALTIAAMIGLRPVAHLIDLLDRPGGHKTHTGAVPVVGGLAMLLGIVFGLATTTSGLAALTHFILSATLLVVVGLLDDRFNLSPKMRLVAQFAAVLPMVFGAGVSLHHFGALFGSGDLESGSLHLAATALVAMAAINAFNMLDGMDGLAGGVALVSFGALLTLGSPTLGPDKVALIAALMGAVVGFLCFNAPIRVNRRIRCFMGDAGSTLLGFSLAWLTITATRPVGSPAGPDPVTMVWLVMVPATDLVWTVVRRAVRGHSPLHPDKEHLHHSLLAAGFGVRAVFVTMIAVSIAAAGTGLMLDRFDVPEWLSLLLLLATGTCTVAGFRRAYVLIPLLPKRLRRLPGPPGTSLPAEPITVQTQRDH